VIYSMQSPWLRVRDRDLRCFLSRATGRSPA